MCAPEERRETRETPEAEREKGPCDEVREKREEHGQRRENGSVTSARASPSCA
jgi:hypothetical protein